ncbi:MAG: rod shape-determining protein MreC [Phycisphaerales bacterium]
MGSQGPRISRFSARTRLSQSPGIGLFGALALLLLLSTLPPATLGFVGALSGAVRVVLLPEQAAINWALRGLSKAGRGPAESDELARARKEAAVYKDRFYHEAEDNERLRGRIAQLERSIALEPRAAVTPRTVPVIGLQAEGNFRFLTLKAGRGEGIEPGQSVATIRGVVLIGRIVDADAFSCKVLPLNDRNAAAFTAAIIPAETTPDGEIGIDVFESAITCNLAPTGDGLLAGDVRVLRQSEVAANAKPAPPPAEGMIVRLRDERWPRLAQMLIVGRVIRVENKEVNRPRIVVRPLDDGTREPDEVPALDTLAEVIVRSPTKEGP